MLAAPHTMTEGGIYMAHNGLVRDTVDFNQYGSAAAKACECVAGSKLAIREITVNRDEEEANS